MGGLKKIFVVFFILSLVSCGGGGGKGGGGSGGGGGTTACSYRGSDYSGCYPARYSTSTYETTEYKNQYGLSSINASSAYSRELDGSGVKVGVFDTGINPDHAEFTGKTISGWDYEGDDSTLSDGDGHGSHVAGIIAARKGNSNDMHGVAYGVTNLYIYKIINDSGAATDGNWETDVPDAVSKAISAGVQVINHSYAMVTIGGSQEINDRTKSLWESSYGDRITAYKSLATNKIINVFAAGNSGNRASAGSNQRSVLMEAGLPYYYSELEDYWIAVINVDSNNKETLTTNRCGVAADWCIAAPGQLVKSVDTDGGYTTLSGTSMAAPHVAGAVAILIETFPTLSAAQIVDRILNTAKTTGLTDYNDNGYSAAVFGHGLLDLDAATKPIEVLALSVGGDQYRQLKEIHAELNKAESFQSIWTKHSC